MTVSELIEQLRTFPPHALVLVNARDRGWDEATAPEAVTVSPKHGDPDEREFYGIGAHEITSRNDSVPAVVISR